MAMKPSDIDKVLNILDQFERQVIDPSLLTWNYLVETAGFSKATLWRNIDIKKKFAQIKKYLAHVNTQGNTFDYEKNKVHKAEQRIQKLKDELEQVKTDNEQLREQLAYAAVVSKRRNIDPTELFDVPLIRRSFDS